MKPQVYVGTYAKYNDGSIFGAWVDLSSFDSHDAFIEHCKALHKDEQDPELMFQDYEGFPEYYYNECEIDPDLWDNYINLDDDDKLLLEAYIDATGDNDATIDDARDSFYGKFDSDFDFAYDYIESTGLLSGLDESIKRYFDYETFTGDLLYDFPNANGYYFSN